ncbi:hypothetical protein Ddc_09823 [Ditylenchus destructor]|nr:hypothetical protein Ddc_09823 [Ditylenchus destructor]
MYFIVFLDEGNSWSPLGWLTGNMPANDQNPGNSSPQAEEESTGPDVSRYIGVGMMAVTNCAVASAGPNISQQINDVIELANRQKNSRWSRLWTDITTSFKSKMKSVFTSVLNLTIRKYLEPFHKDDIHIDVLRGKVTINNAFINAKELSSHFDPCVKPKFIHAKRVEMQLNFRSIMHSVLYGKRVRQENTLLSKLVVKIDGLAIIVGKSPNETCRNKRANYVLLPLVTSKKMDMEFIRQLLLNAKVSVTNVHIRYEQLPQNGREHEEKLSPRPSPKDGHCTMGVTIGQMEGNLGAEYHLPTKNLEKTKLVMPPTALTHLRQMSAENIAIYQNCEVGEILTDHDNRVGLYNRKERQEEIAEVMLSAIYVPNDDIVDSPLVLTEGGDNGEKKATPTT